MEKFNLIVLANYWTLWFTIKYFCESDLLLWVALYFCM